MFAAADLLANDTDADGDTLSITGATGGTSAHGSVAYDAATKQVTYTPDAGYTGPASLTYAIADGKGGTGQAADLVFV